MVSISSQKILAQDPTLEVGRNFQPYELVKKGPTVRTAYVNASNTPSDTNLNWTQITPPSLSTVVDRKLEYRYTFLVGMSWTKTSAQPQYPGGFGTIVSNVSNGTVTPAPLVTPQPTIMNTASPNYNFTGTFSLKPFPLQAVTTTTQLYINQTPTSVQSSQIVPYLYPRMISATQSQWETGVCPIRKDLSCLPIGMVLPGYPYSANNPMAHPLSSNTPTNNCGYTCIKLVDNQATANPNYAALKTEAAIWQITVTEPVVLSPCVFGDIRDDSGFCGVSNMALQLTLGDLTGMLNLPVNWTIDPLFRVQVTLQRNMSLAVVDPGATGGGYTLAASRSGDDPQLITMWNTADAMTTARIPPILQYQYEQLLSFVVTGNNMGTGAAGAVTENQITTNSIQFSSLPSRIYMYVRLNDAFLGSNPNPGGAGVRPYSYRAFTGNGLLRIKRISVNFLDRASLMYSYNETDLWQMSVKNGIPCSLYDWQNGGGSLLCLDVTEDLCVNDELTPGQSIYSQFQATLTYDNTPLLTWASNAAMVLPTAGGAQWDVYIVAVLPGKAIIPSGNPATFVITGAAPTEVLSLLASDGPKVPQGDVSQAKETVTQGGSLMGHLKNLAMKGLGHVISHPEHVAAAANMVRGALGDGSGVTAGGVSGGGGSRRYK